MISGVVGRVRAQPRSRLTAAAGAVVLAVSAPFGGLGQVPLDERVRAAEPGEAVDAAPFRLTFQEALAVDEVPDVVTPDVEGNHLMVVLAEVTNDSDSWVYANLLSPVPRSSPQSRVIVVLDDDLAPTGFASTYHAEDDTRFSTVNPGLTYDVAIVWEFAGAVPDELPLGIATLTLRPSTISPDVLEWTDPAEAATLTLPVEDRTAP